MLANLTMRDLRRRVLRPVEGVFLFHPRVMERLIRRHLGDSLPNLAITPLGYYLIPRQSLLIGLEEENPDALSVIEGLNLPDWLILLPMPSTPELAAGDSRYWLRGYWGRRFEAEVARAWQVMRVDNQDHDSFGARGLVREFGERALREVRAVLERDRRVVLDSDDETLCRQFVGFVTYLRYFVPGARAHFFPAIQDWGGLDRWLKDGGLVFALPLIGIARGLGLNVDGLPAFLLVLGFIMGNLLRNSQSGRRLLDGAITRFFAFWRGVHRTLLIGLFRWVVDLFGGLMRGFEQGLHRVDETVSHHRDEGWGVTMAKALVGPVWRALRYVIHFYVAVLVEPQINPIKHFPVVTVADKLMLPFFPALTTALLVLLDPVLPRFISLPLATVTVLLSPGLFGFLAWELKENWELYRANHPDRAQPAHFGPDGETLYTLLRPGFHSGVLPEAFAELREVIGLENEHERPWPQRLRQAEARLSEILESLRAFVTRELGFALLERARAAGYERAKVAVMKVDAATAALDIRVALNSFGREEQCG